MQLEHKPGRGADKLPLEHEVQATSPGEEAGHPLDGGEATLERRTIEDWYHESTEALSEAFAEMALDHDYYDHHQWSEAERAELIARGQAPLVYNKCAMVVDWLTGTERRTRVDFAVRPKREDAADVAELKQKLLKYQSDTNLIGWNRSQAFKDAAIGGVGWTECSIRGDGSQDVILHSHVPWAQMRWDPFSRKLDLDDCRYLHRRRWIDLDYAVQRFPDRKDVLRLAARSHLFGDEEFDQEMLDLPQVARQYDSSGREVVQRRWSTSMPITGSTMRLRVPLTETWFRQPQATKLIYGLDLPGVRYDPDNVDMRNAVEKGYASLSDAVTEQIRLHIWVPGASLWRGESPFSHGSFPYTPIWYKRRNKDGAPYGAIRGIRDAQDDFNKRMSKAQWLLATNQLLYEEGAIDPDRKTEVRRNLSKPSGMAEFTKGALQNNRIKVERNTELAQAQTMLLEIAGAHIHDGSGVNRELLGRETNAISGRAIRAKQDEGSVATAELYDNLRLAVQLDGKKLLSLCEDYMTLPMQIRIAGDDAVGKGIEWMRLNEPIMLEDGSWEIKNDITQHDADFVVDQIDYRESVRAAQAEQFFEMLSALPPELQASLLDIAIEMTDIPNKDEAVRRIRAVTGQGGDGLEADPVAEAQRQQQEMEAQREREVQMRERLAKAGLDEARREEVLARARKLNVEGKGSALQIAQLIEALLPLASAADRLYNSEEQQPHATSPV